MKDRLTEGQHVALNLFCAACAAVVCAGAWIAFVKWVRP